MVFSGKWQLVARLRKMQGVDAYIDFIRIYGDNDGRMTDEMASFSLVLDDPFGASGS